MSRAHYYITVRLMGGYLLWNDSEAYIFLGDGLRGVDHKLLEQPRYYLLEFFGGIEQPLNDREQVIVFRVQASKVERHTWILTDREPGAGPRDYTPANDVLYASCPTLGGLCRWSGETFEAVTGSAKTHENLVVFQHGDVDHFEDGWSRRVFGSGLQDYEYSVKGSDGSQLSVGSSQAVFSIRLRPTKGQTQTLFSATAQPTHVSGTEYRREFGND